MYIPTHGRRRERITPVTKSSGTRIIGRWKTFYNGSWQPWPYGDGSQTATWPSLYLKAESVVDEIPHYKSKGVWTGGGPFTRLIVTRASEVPQGVGSYNSGSRTQFFSGLGNVKVMYNGGFTNPSFPGDFYTSADYTDLKKMLGPTFLVPSMDGWGPEAWARTAPKLEKGSGFVALAESKDVGRMLSTTSRGFHDIWRTMGGGSTSARGYRESLGRHFLNGGLQTPKKISDQFLNHVFGWAPFISDLQKFSENNLKFFQYYDYLKRNNGEWKHYRRTLKDDVTKTLVASGTGMRCEPQGNTVENVLCKPGTARWEVWEEKYTLITTSGRFKFYIPDIDPKYPNNYPGMSTLYAWLMMHGLRVSPSSVWRATPWSWLIDWRFNIGRNLDVITSALYDGVVADYLYLMHHTVSRLACYQYLSFDDRDVTLLWTRDIECKQRKRSESPFGFDSPWDTLSPMRLAILAALGITKH